MAAQDAAEILVPEIENDPALAAFTRAVAKNAAALERQNVILARILSTLENVHITTTSIQAKQDILALAIGRSGASGVTVSGVDGEGDVGVEVHLGKKE